MEITATIVNDFRGYYPEFAVANYPDALVTRALEAADQETGSTRWGGYTTEPASFKARGLFAYAAHSASLAKAAARATESGMVASAPSRVASKSVGDESVSYAVPTPTASEAAGIGDLNTTIYGQEFLRLRKRAGMGAATTGMVRL